MEKYLVKRIFHKADIVVEVPGSKSITNRALLMAAMADGVSKIEGVLFSQDSRYFLQALKDLGFFVEVNEPQKEVTIRGEGGKIPKEQAEIYVGSAGTAARFLTAFLAMGTGRYRIDASEQMKKRPMKELLVVLEELGAVIEYEEEPYTFPLKMQGIAKAGKRTVELNIDRSSQFLSALLMVAPLRFEELTISLTGKRSARSYVAMTEQMMKQFGHTGVEQTGENVYRVCKEDYQTRDYQVEPDVSAACYFYAMAAVNGGSAVVKHMRRDSLQGDMRFLEVLEQMGCSLEWKQQSGEEVLVLNGPAAGELKGISVSLSDFSDQALTLAAIAPYASSEVEITGIGHIRQQECDRIHAMAEALHTMEITCEERQDGIKIFPGMPKPGSIQTFDDHRVAMAFAVTGIGAEGIEIQNPTCCQKTFPEYFAILDTIADENR